MIRDMRWLTFEPVLVLLKTGTVPVITRPRPWETRDISTYFTTTHDQPKSNDSAD